MLKQFLLAVVSVIVLGSSVFSNTWTDTLSGSITTNVTLQNTKRYLMLGTVFVKSGATLNIPAGTQIFGDKNSKGTLVIERGGTINANGNALAPIVFTSAQPVGTKAAGDWGGVIILGKARINTASGADTAAIEGISPSVFYGGTNDADNSGTFRYVRIEYSGIALSPNNEINGLTMGGVGSGTTIEYVMVAYNGDDSFEWFGGTVNCKYLISYNPVDDEFDTDFGYRGKLQFLLGIRKPSIADISGSTCFESDNNNGPNNNTPRTQPLFSNVTSIGPKQYDTSVVNPNYTRMGHLRRNSLISIVNSVAMGWPTGAYYDGSGVTCAVQNDTSRVKANVFAGLYTLAGSTNAGCGFDASGYTNSNNTIFAAITGALLNSPYSGVSTGNYSPANFFPAAGSPALNGANFTLPGMNDPFFTPTTYRGAFDQNSTWANDWTNFRPDTVNYKLISIGIEPISNLVPKSYSLQQNYPNPFNPTTNIKFDVAANGFAKLVVFDVLGREVATLVSEELKAGQYAVNYNASSLPSGVYLYRLTVSGNNATFVDTKKLVLVK
ncbi:MAG TPA: T9SS type A sorting domain-containing protein [Ignavibacteria bacterium]|nr:T9SS type A sorting domain-containing protein [Ignavibacteria bacterium]HMQ98147.1 T9SS type A sorting domain-containing protein [Ignavibacteria bacterium]